MTTPPSESAFPVSRRTFLKTTACAAAAACAAPAVGADPPARWEMRLSTSSIHYLHLPVGQACEQIAKLGFPAVDVWSGHAGCPHLDDVLNNLGPDGLQKILDDTKLKLFSFSVYRGGFPRYAELLGAMGGGVAIQGSAAPCKPEELTGRMKQFMEQIKPQVELAEKHNCKLAVENHGHALLDSVDSFKAFCDLNTSPHLGIALAPYHVQGIGGSVPEVIETCGDQLFYFYAWQRAGGTEQLPGIGPIDFVPWLAALAKVNYAGYVNPFMHGELSTEAMDAALARSKAYLEECYAKAVAS